MNTTPLVASILNATALQGNGQTITLRGPVTLAASIPIQHVAGLQVVTPGIGYSFSSTQTLACSGCTGVISPATASPAVLGAQSVTIGNVGGGGGPDGKCILTAIDETALAGLPSTIRVSISGGSIDRSVAPVLVNAGTITTLSSAATYNSTTGAYNETVSGCGSLAGAKLNLKYGIQLEQINHGTGLYASGQAPSCSNAATLSTTSGDAGAGLMVSCSGYGSTAAWGTDNTAALQAALAMSNAAAAAGSPQCLYFPAGNYLTRPLNTHGANGSAAAGELFQGYGCILGDERLHSNIFVIPAVAGSSAGDVFAWRDANANASAPRFGNTQSFAPKAGGTGFNQAGSAIRNIAIIGNRASQASQNAIIFYGPTTDAAIDQVIVSFMNGHAISAGNADTTGIGNLADSRISNIFVDDSGSGTATAALEITATGGPGSTNIDLTNTRFFDSYGPSVWLHAGTGATTNTSDIRILNMKIEDSGMSQISTSTSPVGDLLLLGGGNPSGVNVSDILCRNVDLVNAAFPFAALHVAGDTAADTARIDCEGTIANGPNSTYSRGLQVDACQQCAFREANNTGADYALEIGPTNCGGAHLAPPGLIYDGNGAESSLQTCIDPTITGLVQTP